MRFADVAGHAHVKDLLIRAGERDRVAHAYLFHGPEGVGKRTMALAFLSWLVCRDHIDGDACGRCVPCRQVEDGTFVDLAILKPDKGYIKIDAIRDAVPRLYFEPLVGPWKCLIVDDAHAMTLEAANAALKTLEEPPSRTFFVLVTPTPDVLPRTVLSRCFHVPFGPVAAEDVAALLVRRGADEVVAHAAAARSRGSPARATRFLDPDLVTEREDFLKGFLDLATAGPATRLEFAEGFAKSKEDSEGLVDLLESVVHDVLLAATGAPDHEMANADMAGPVRAFAERVGRDGALRLAASFLEWDGRHRYSPNTRIALDAILLSF